MSLLLLFELLDALLKGLRETMTDSQRYIPGIVHSLQERCSVKEIAATLQHWFYVNLKGSECLKRGYNILQSGS